MTFKEKLHYMLHKDGLESFQKAWINNDIGNFLNFIYKIANAGNFEFRIDSVIYL